MAREQKYGEVTTEKGNIPADEPVFLLRAQDKLAVAAIHGYANLRAAAGDITGANAVRDAAAHFESWPADRKKMPD